MKQKLLLLMLLIFTIKSFSQDSEFSVEANYPIPIDDNFIGKNYNGIIDIGIKYRFASLTSINIGATLNAGLLENKTNLNGGLVNFEVTSYMIQPKIFGELNLKSITKLHPSIGFGYTFMIFDVEGIVNEVDVSDLDETRSGINVNFGIAYDITEKLIIQMQYDFTKVGVDDEIPNVKFNTNINILKIGLGLRL